MSGPLFQFLMSTPRFAISGPRPWGVFSDHYRHYPFWMILWQDAYPKKLSEVASISALTRGYDDRYLA